MQGVWCVVEPLDPAQHADDLEAAFRGDDSVWDYMGYGPFSEPGAYRQWAENAAQGDDPLFHAIVDRSSGRALGVASYLRIDPSAGAIEVGHIAFSPALQRTRIGTEAMALMMRRAFELGYRRYEWKCNALNARSRKLAQRLGLSYEGVFRQAAVVKGRNRDTAWYAAIDSEWPALAQAFGIWLDPANFDAAGNQRRSLSDLTRQVLVNIG
jgi:RimJ/RimL family protein N-acetyltransferase